MITFIWSIEYSISRCARVLKVLEYSKYHIDLRSFFTMDLLLTLLLTKLSPITTKSSGICLSCTVSNVAPLDHN